MAARSISMNDGQDIQGMAGFHDKVDNHYKRLVVLPYLRALHGWNRAVAKANTSLLTTPTAGQTRQRAWPAARRAGDGNHPQEFEHPANRQDSDRLSFHVRVNRDILFETPYIPAEL